MSHKSETPFDCVESAHEFVDLLLEAVEDARRDVEEEIKAAVVANAVRRKEALLIVSHRLAALSGHVGKSRRILNDLRTLRRLLLEERKSPVAAEESRPARLSASVG